MAICGVNLLATSGMEDGVNSSGNKKNNKHQQQVQQNSMQINENEQDMLNNMDNLNLHEDEEEKKHLENLYNSLNSNNGAFYQATFSDFFQVFDVKASVIKPLLEKKGKNLLKNSCLYYMNKKRQIRNQKFEVLISIGHKIFFCIVNKDISSVENDLRCALRNVYGSNVNHSLLEIGQTKTFKEFYEKYSYYIHKYTPKQKEKLQTSCVFGKEGYYPYLNFQDLRDSVLKIQNPQSN